MADEPKKCEVPKHLDDIKGDKREQLQQRVQIIRDHGPQVWQELVARSGRGTKR